LKAFPRQFLEQLHRKPPRDASPFDKKDAHGTKEEKKCAN
jgi:hypothetical protein